MSLWNLRNKKVNMQPIDCIKNAQSLRKKIVRFVYFMKKFAVENRN